MRRLKLAFSSIYYSFILWLPAEFSKVRVRYYNKKGCTIHERTSISPNVRIRGLLKMEEGSSIAHNCTLSGEKAGIFIGKNVMIAPNVVIVAFNHGYDRTDIPMSSQDNTEETIIIEDDVWIASNSTISKGVRIGRGAIVGANSLIVKDVEAYTIVGGVPAKVINNRKAS